LDLLHLNKILTTKCHQNSFATRILVDVSPMLKEHVCHPECESFVLVEVLVLVKAREAVDEG
jgi:hypothetical protein